MCVSVYLHGCICTMFVPYVLRGHRKDIGYFQTEDPDGCELPFGFWEPNLGLLQEQLVLLTTDSSLPCFKFCLVL